MNAQALGWALVAWKEKKNKNMSSVLNPQHCWDKQASFQEVLEAAPGLGPGRGTLSEPIAIASK